MAKPYSDDLRSKVIKAIELDGMKRCEASECFGISRNTIHQWFKLRDETGDIKPRVRKRDDYGQKIRNWEEFRAFALKHYDKTQEEMAELWEGNISPRTIGRALEKIEFTRKKKAMAIKNETSKNGVNFRQNKQM